MDGMDYTAVTMATKRFETKAQKDPHLQEVMEKVREQCEVWILLKNPLFCDTGQNQGDQNTRTGSFQLVLGASWSEVFSQIMRREGFSAESSVET
jgi:hypothetical protein